MADMAADTGAVVRLKPGRAVLMDQDVLSAGSGGAIERGAGLPRNSEKTQCAVKAVNANASGR